MNEDTMLRKKMLFDVLIAGLAFIILCVISSCGDPEWAATQKSPDEIMVKKATDGN